MKIAVLGFPQSGKRTMFALLTGRKVGEGRKEAEAIEGVAQVRDPRVDRIAEIAKPEKIKYAEMQLVLCPDVSAEGGKRDWLEAARRCDLLCMVIRAFTSDSVYHPKGSVDAKRDRSDLETELLLADMELGEKRLDRIQREKRAGQTPAQVLEEKTLTTCLAALEKGQFLSKLEWQPHELLAVKNLGFLTLLPVLWTYNVDENQLRSGESEPHAFVISCLIESEIMAIEDAAERREFLQTLGLEPTGIDRLAGAAYDALGLMSFYTMGSDEVRAWTIRKGSTAPAAGGKVHSDIERGFIRAEIIKYADLLEAGSEAAAHAAGKVHLKGRDYVIEDGDICNFRFNV